MKFIADFHIHSHYSRATSKELVPEYLDYWARLKGITVVGTGDFTHPGWVAELKEKLEPAEQGLFKLKDQYRKAADLETKFLPGREVRFMLTAEISNIYKKNGRVRKVHNVIFAPDFETVEKIKSKLLGINANITSDGRPILGLDSRDLLEMALDSSERIFFVPAHIWTPWFSVLGDKSGFDTVAECYDDLAEHIYAVETGLSTDPPMNWMCGFLDNYTLIANSDAHSPEKLGRNANRFDTGLSYDEIIGAMKTGNGKNFLGSIDMFPQEGKYHYDGHRKCGVLWNPVETLKHERICSVCGKPVTVGVMYRVVQLSDREDLRLRPNRHDFQSIIPLKEILGELAGVGPGSRKVARAYMDLIKQGVPELELLLETPVDEIERLGGDELGEAIRRMRNREVYIREGFDGEFGVIKVFGENERPNGGSKNQTALFKELVRDERQVPPRRDLINFDLEEYRRLHDAMVNRDNGTKETWENKKKTGAGLNHGQQAAVRHGKGPALVIAGPGTGKTKVLTSRVEHLIDAGEVEPGNILAVTFTNKAAVEIAERLDKILKEKNREEKNPGSAPHVMTFHSLGYTILKEQEGTGFTILEPGDKKRVLQKVADIPANKTAALAKEIETAKQQLKRVEDLETEKPELAAIFSAYLEFMREHRLLDFDDMLYGAVMLLEKEPGGLDIYRERFQWIMIDEYQDINYAQYRLIRLLMPDSGSNLCAIGDPDQAIYGFRGADVQYIQRFQDDYPGARVYRLKQSYRCSDSILRASGNIMKRGGGDDGILKGMEEGLKIKIVKNVTHKSEAEYVARTIEQMMGGLRFFSMDSDITQGHKDAEIGSLSDFVVLCRVKSQMQAIEKAFQDHTIPYELVGEEPFFKQEPAASVLDALKLARGPGNFLLEEKLKEKGIMGTLEAGTLGKMLVGQKTVKGMLVKLVENFFQGKESSDGIKRLLEMAERYGRDVEKFMEFTALGTSADTYRPNLENATIMTLHAAKGLEFNAVFIVGCEEGLIPYSMFSQHESDVEEERRLLYVGMTRAKKYLFLSHAEKRYLMNREHELPRSPFLNNIEKQLIEWARQEHKKESKEPVQRTLFDL